MEDALKSYRGSTVDLTRGSSSFWQQLPKHAIFYQWFYSAQISSQHLLLWLLRLSLTYWLALGEAGLWSGPVLERSLATISPCSFYWKAGCYRLCRWGRLHLGRSCRLEYSSLQDIFQFLARLSLESDSFRILLFPVQCPWLELQSFRYVCQPFVEGQWSFQHCLDQKRWGFFRAMCRHK